MICARCHGLMVKRDCWERESWQVSRRWVRPYRMWSCLNTIAFNRRQHGSEMTSRRHEQIWDEIVRQLQEVA